MGNILLYYGKKAHFLEEVEIGSILLTWLVLMPTLLRTSLSKLEMSPL